MGRGIARAQAREIRSVADHDILGAQAEIDGIDGLFNAVAAVEPEQPAEDAASTIETFEESLGSELDKLRQAIAALDASFRRPAPAAEPSFADLVTDRPLRATG